MDSNITIKANSLVFTQEQLDFICEKYFETGNTRFCEEYFNISKPSVLKAVRKNGKQPIKHSNRGFVYVDNVFLRFLLEKGYSVPQISLLLGIDVRCCRNSIIRHSLQGLIPKTKSANLTPNQVRLICDQYLGGSNSITLADAFFVSNDTILKVLKQNGVQIKNKNHCRYLHKNYNENAFSVPGEERDYFFGFLLADGWLKSNLNIITINIKQTDFKLLEDLKKFLRSDNSIRYYDRFDKRTKKTYKICHFSFSGKPVTDCVSFGFSLSKSLKESVKEKYFLTSRHFWRGMIDGDGSVRICKNRSNNSFSKQISLCGSSEIIDSFIDYCQKFCNVNFKPTIRKVKTKKDGLFLFSVTFCGNNCLKIIKILYNDSGVFLERKKSTVENILKNTKESSSDNDTNRDGAYRDI